MRGYAILPRARTDLRQIWSFSLSRWGRTQADRYISDIEICFSNIAENPRLGRPSSKRPNHFEALVGSHVVIYRVRNESIAIARVLHQRMNLPRHY